jgi:hypothetical protein
MRSFKIAGKGRDTRQHKTTLMSRRPCARIFVEEKNRGNQDFVKLGVRSWMLAGNTQVLIYTMYIIM